MTIQGRTIAWAWIVLCSWLTAALMSRGDWFGGGFGLMSIAGSVVFIALDTVREALGGEPAVLRLGVKNDAKELES